MIEHNLPVPRKETQALYDRLARWYDFFGGFWENRLRLEALRKLTIQPGETALEIGPGTGHALVEIGKSAGQGGRIIGIDLSPKMLLQSRGKVIRQGLLNQVSLACGDAGWLPLENGLCDAVFMSFTLELFASREIQAVLRECGRVLRPGGKIGVVSLSSQGSKTLVRGLYEWSRRRFPRWIDCRPIPLQEALVEAGFIIQAQSLESLWGLPVEIVIAQMQG